MPSDWSQNLNPQIKIRIISITNTHQLDFEESSCRLEITPKSIIRILQALLILSGLVEGVVAVHAAASADGLDRLLRIAAPLGQEHGSSLSSLSSRVHHVVNLLLRPSRLVPHLLSFSDRLDSIGLLAELRGRNPSALS